MAYHRMRKKTTSVAKLRPSALSLRSQPFARPFRALSTGLPRDCPPSEFVRRFWQRLNDFSGFGAENVTGANSRARTCTQEYAAAAKLNRKNHLRAHRKDPDWEAAVPAREFAPVTSAPYKPLISDPLRFFRSPPLRGHKRGPI